MANMTNETSLNQQNAEYIKTFCQTRINKCNPKGKPTTTACRSCKYRDNVDTKEPHCMFENMPFSWKLNA